LSTEPYTFKIFRIGVLEGNRQILAANVAKFIVDKLDNKLDGVDFGWEYPGVVRFPALLTPGETHEGDADLSDFRVKIFPVSVRTNWPRAKTMPTS
jgi:GH18 family chitinase